MSGEPIGFNIHSRMNSSKASIPQKQAMNDTEGKRQLFIQEPPQVENEVEWIEAYGWDDDVQEESQEGLGDLFADPDPFETFHFNFSINNNKQDSIPITLQGYKAENGQTLNSTGLTLWRASRVLCDYLVDIAGQKLMQQKTVLELGAGLGICGILAHKLGASYVVLTDGDTDTLKALRKNVASNVVLYNDDNNNDSCSIPPTILCKQLRWGRNIQDFIDSSFIKTFQVIIGSDIIYAQEQVNPLFTTVSLLLDANGTFLLAYSRRNVSIDYVLDCANLHGFVWTEPENSEGVFAFRRKSIF
mmetsp:Transcript_12079/g.17417  ORF Transcript_12079/g.17417 Transcript_12079/m.17417 type:complete len:302 (+) Transcript_12079:42-947(+)|eukprot:CAMPEP_0172435180 /NCGR_PEP_ID=MMETSP1064-20121228/71033_1 /TAXON_ID=202472 /ORGANISM="Aulacoseira subarctica , Strain CCAP 1002/5" /LENGTH=301 /DNA_ID=CAMNT_0013183465 /DNA_START=41 /DNA_END=946 /DNA_ORIENTATION=+